jgi:hypothetical protein
MAKNHGTDWSNAKAQRAVQDLCFTNIIDNAGDAGLILQNCDFEGFNASNSRWTNCTFGRCTFRDSYFVRARFSNCRFLKCKYLDCGLSSSTFDDLCHFDSCKIYGCDLTNAHLTIPHPTALRIKKSRLKGTRIVGHSFFDQFFPEFVCDAIKHGQQATVYLARRTSDEFRVAIKSYNKRFGDASSSLLESQRIREYENLSRVSSPFIPGLLSHNLGARTPFLVLERCEGRPLSDWIQMGERFEGKVRHDLFTQAFSGLLSLQGNAGSTCVLLRDIAPKNVIVDAREPIRWKYIDLGLSKCISGTRDLASMQAGTPLTMAPEVFTRGIDSAQTEIFSLGVTLAWAVLGRHPFGERQMSKKERVELIRRGPQLDGIETPFREVLETCLQYDMHKRFASPQEALTALAM